MLASYIVWTALTAYFKRSLDQKASNAVVAFIFIYYFFYDIAWTPLLQAYPVEIYPYTLRGRGFTVTLASTYIGLIVGSFVNPIAMKQIGWKYYVVFCSTLALLLTISPCSRNSKVSSDDPDGWWQKGCHVLRGTFE
jgi:fucose permease